jgi:cytochrome c peroxidase
MNMRIIEILKKAYLCVCLFLCLYACGHKQGAYTDKKAVNEGLTELYMAHLQKSIAALDSMTGKSPQVQQSLYREARKYFKLAEPVLAYTDKNNYKSLNAPNIIQVKGEESNDTKVLQPIGFQVIEEIVFEEKPDSLELITTVQTTSSRLKLIAHNTDLQLRDYHLIWLLREQIVRIATTGITGFDSPVLSASLQESAWTYATLLEVLKMTKPNFSSQALYQQMEEQVLAAIAVLKGDFESFDRYAFIKNHIHPQLKTLVAVQRDWKVEFPFEMALSNTMTSLFSASSLNLHYFTDYQSDTTHYKERIAFGEALFEDASLSKNKTMSCASCHDKSLAFTDGKRVFDAKQQRNTPTVTYAAYQRGFFMDARAGSLEGQVVGVVKNHNEFNTSMDSIVARVEQHPRYAKTLSKLSGGKRKAHTVQHALASYIRTLNRFDSKFDKNINGVLTTLSEDEKQGFNLFMGKALCATCHFAPVFNGTVPPNYNDTELEALGTPNLTQTALSDDLGRYELFKTPERKHFFKTPTVRNVSKTGPYMHNGVYESLDEVVEFYNKGGGVGLGFKLPHQTLPFDNLDLSDKEIQQLVAFMNSLTDSY